jgi:hypothetical protein
MSSKPSMRDEARSMLSNLVERGEEVVSVFLEELGRNPRVREQLGKTVERAVDAKRRVDRTTQTVWSALNVPSRADYNRLLSKLEALQGTLVNLSMKMDRVLAQQHPSGHASTATHAHPAAAARHGQRRAPSAKRKARPAAK